MPRKLVLRVNYLPVYVTGLAYDSGNSVDFELHPSEEVSLVKRILMLSGIMIKDELVVQATMQDESTDFAKENATRNTL